MGAVVEENIWSWSCVWRRLGPVLKQCQTPEVGGSSGASSLHSRTWARDRMPTTALRSALSRSQQADHRKNKRTRVEGKGDKRETEKKWNRLRPTDRILGRGTILLYVFSLTIHFIHASTYRQTYYSTQFSFGEQCLTTLYGSWQHSFISWWRRVKPAHIQTCGAVKRTFSILKSRFRCLDLSAGGMLYSMPDRCSLLQIWPPTLGFIPCVTLALLSYFIMTLS